MTPPTDALNVNVKPLVEARALARNLQKPMLFVGHERRKVIDVIGDARKAVSRNEHKSADAFEAQPALKAADPLPLENLTTALAGSN